MVGALGFVVFFFLLPSNGVLGLVMAIVGAMLFGSLAALIIFGRRAQRSAYAQMDGQRGAAGAALRMLRRGWKTREEPVAITKQMDVVYRVVGPPGIVLIGEGNQNRLRQLMATERRKHERVASETPIHEVICGNGEGEVPLPEAGPPRPEARPRGEAGRDDRHPQPAQGARRPAVGDPDPQGTDADQHEGAARQHAWSLRGR